jgi:aminoglycoside phosphotransferase (APT) family kinase protein
MDRAASFAREISSRYGEVASVDRFPTGLCHYVYDVELVGGDRLVVRIADPANRHLLAGAVAWSGRLRPLGVPLPELISFELEGDQPYLVLERLPGTDLGEVYGDLTLEQGQRLAGEVAGIQGAVASLGPAAGYGYSADPAAVPPRQAWVDVVRDNLERSGARLAGTSLEALHAKTAAMVLAAVPEVLATPFLDDVTTKNVIVHDGRLSGVVDVDVVCFGDPLYTPALTKVSLVASGQPLDYIDSWLAGRDDLGAFDLYTAVFCLDLLSEHGQQFNQDAAVTVDRERSDRLIDLLVSLT